MTADAAARAAKPVLVHGLTDALGAAFGPLVQGLSQMTAPQGADVNTLIAQRGELLADALDQYAGGQPTKPEDLARPKPTSADNTEMLTGPWQAVSKAQGDAVPAPVATFATAIMQRIALSGLPTRDQAMLNNLLLLLTLGAISYWLTGHAGASDPLRWASEAVDRSGVADILSSGDHIAIDGATLRRLPVGAPMTRVVAERTQTMLRMQNLFYVKQLFDAAKRGHDNAFGMQMRA